MLGLSDLKFSFIEVRLSVKLQIEGKLERLIVVLIGADESNCKNLKVCLKFQINGTPDRKKLKESEHKWN